MPIRRPSILRSPNQPSIWRLRYRRTDVGKFPNVGSTEIRMAIQAAFSLLRASSAARCAFLAAEIISLMRLCTAGCGISWIKASHELHQAEYGSSTNPAADRSISFALLRNGLVICVPAVLAGIGRIGQSSIYLKNGSVSTWGAYLGKYRLLMTLALLGAFALGPR